MDMVDVHSNLVGLAVDTADSVGRGWRTNLSCEMSAQTLALESTAPITGAQPRRTQRRLLLRNPLTTIYLEMRQMGDEP